MLRQEITLSTVNQVTIPSLARQRLGVKAGDKLDLVYRDDQTIVLEKAESNEEKVRRLFRELDEWRDSLPQEVKDNIKKHAGWTIDQYHEYYDKLPETKAYIKEKYGVQNGRIARH